MAKRNILNSLIISLSVLLSASSANAFFIDKIFKSPTLSIPTFDFMQDAVTVAKSVGQTLVTTQKTYNTTQSNINDARSMINSVMNFDYEAGLNGVLNPGTRAATNCKIGEMDVNINDADSVEEAVKVIMFEAPHPEMQDKFNYNRLMFIADNTLEVLNASQQLSVYLETEVKPKIEDVKNSVVSGGGGLPASDGKNEALFNEGAAVEALDDLLLVLQKVASLRAQLRAVNAMSIIEPNKFDMKEYAKKKQKASSDSSSESNAAPASETATESDKMALLMEIPGKAKYSQTSPLAFAQLKTSASVSSAQAIKAVAVAEKASLDKVSQRQLKVLSKSAELVDMPKDSAVDDALKIRSSNTAGLDKASRIQLKKLTKSVTFSQAPETEISHAYYREADKMSELDKIEPISQDVDEAVSVHNMINKLPSYKAAAEGYAKIVEKHKKAVESLKTSQQCVQQFLGRRYNDSLAVFNGGVKDVTAYDQMKGIGGWTIDAFETAKAAQVTTDTIGDEVSVSYDYDENLKITPQLAQKNDLYDKVKQMKTSSGSPQRQEQALKDNRATMLIPWEVGSEASKLLAATPEKWGSVKKDFPIWTDTKSFYNQYLNGKYANVTKLLKGFSVNDVKALIIAQLQGISKKSSETRKQKEFSRLDTELNAEAQKYHKEYEAEYDKNLQNRSTAETALMQKRAALASQLEEAASEYKSVTDEISDRRIQIEDDTMNRIRNNVIYVEPFPQSIKTDKEASLLYPFGYTAIIHSDDRIASASMKASEMEATFNNASKIKKQEAGLNKLEIKEKEMGNKVGTLKDSLKKLDKQIAEEKLKSQAQIAGIKSSVQTKLTAMKEKFEKTKDEYEQSFAADADNGLNVIAEGVVAKLKEKFTQKFGASAVFTGPTPLSLVNGLNAVIEEALDGLYDQVDARMDVARKQLAELGDDLYDPLKHEKIVAIHQKFIDDVKAMVLTVNYPGLGVASKIYLYETLLTADTTPETEGYFVGYPAKARDLKAPMALPGFNIPPLREMVYFDEDDFQNVKPYDKKRKDTEPIAREDFLNYGREIPEIWRLVLQDKVFVERDINLKAFLDEGCTQVAFFRGGFMPCRVKGGSVVVDVNADGEYIKGISGSGLNECPYLEMRNGNVYNTALEENIVFASHNRKSAPIDCAYSELGTLLTASDDGTLYFRQTTYDAYRAVIGDMEDLEEKGDDYKSPKLTHAYEDGLLKNNQFGDYLRYVENEQNARKQVEETKQDYEEAIKMLKEMLLKYGYVVSEDFDIAKDFDLVRSRLDKIKNEKIADALKKIEDVDVVDNDVVSQRVDKYKATISALQKDKDELTFITDVVAENNNLDEKLKSSKVDKEVADRYTDHLQKKADEIAKISATPYCAIY